MTDAHRVIKILLAEDNPDDITLIRKALNEARVINQLWIVRDGEETINYLKHTGKYQDARLAPTPGLILLDMNLPKVNGLDVLKMIKQEENLKRIPTVLLTVSKREQDIASGYAYGCNSYIQKPVEFEEFVQLVKQIGLYWGLINTPLPQ